MSLDVVYGESRERPLAVLLAKQLEEAASTGTVYLGYPVLSTADIRVYVDALLVSPERGLVAFQLSSQEPNDVESWQETVDDQDQLFGALESHLGRHDSLRRGRKFAIPIETVTVFPADVGQPPPGSEGHYCSIGEVGRVVRGFSSLDGDLYTNLEAALQRVTTIKPSKRRLDAVTEGSRGAILRQIERGIANLDFWQKQAAIETPDGPQRVRGLAGSGKTIVLALKAAYLHAQHPDWTIAVTFQSRALYQQFEDLITRFTFEHSNDQPDFDRLHILHAWGSADRTGIYRRAAERAGHAVRNWNYARSTFGQENAFGGICGELCDFIDEIGTAPYYDAVLIDEAQDLPPEFFRLVYSLTSDPKRVVLAYDELQNLSESAMPIAEELFGLDTTGRARVSFENAAGEARRDIVLPVCYRNSPWALTIAHALGFGIYRDDGLVQHFDGTQLWSDIGYSVQGGTLAAGERVTLGRGTNSTPVYFEELIDEPDAVEVRSFSTADQQDAWVASEIASNLTDDELEPDDILVVLPNAYTAKSRAPQLSRHLEARGIASHLVGVGSSVDEVFFPGSVAVAHIHRAKGNEAPMVYILDAQYGMKGRNPVARRNSLFTGITRSRAWVRIAGFGEQMNQLEAEIRNVRDHDYKLDFEVPTKEELGQMRRIHLDRADFDRDEIDQTAKTLDQLVEELESGELDLSELHPSLRRRLIRLLRADDAEFS